MTSQATPVRLAGVELGDYQHVCAFFATQEDEYRTLLPFVREGRFDQDAMLALIQHTLTTGHALGFPLTRLVAHGECVARDLGDGDSFMEYESRLNYVLPHYPDAVVCTYDLGQITAALVIDVLRTHPMVIVGGVLQHNPFFVSPDIYLSEKREAQPPEIPVTAKAASRATSTVAPDAIPQA